MPRTKDGDCPIGEFTYDGVSGPNKDPVECCAECNFSNSSKKFDDACQCPLNMTSKEALLLQQKYEKTNSQSTRSKVGFQKFVAENFKET